jgi:hypothetical protein
MGYGVGGSEKIRSMFKGSTFKVQKNGIGIEIGIELVGSSEQVI